MRPFAGFANLITIEPLGKWKWDRKDTARICFRFVFLSDPLNQLCNKKNAATVEKESKKKQYEKMSSLQELWFWL